MSSEKGNLSRTRPQKHKNRTAFSNTLHDTSHRTKLINSIQVADVCARCKDIIEWKIKYKKYKPLTQLKKCVKCGLKTVKQAYHVMCVECGKKNGVCTKCCEKKEVYVVPPSKSEYELDLDVKNALIGLSERRRRTFLRYLDKKRKETDAETEQTTTDEEKNDLLEKIKSLKVQDKDEDSDDDRENEVDSDLDENKY